MRTVLVLYDIHSEAQKRVAILDHIRFLDHAPADRVRVRYVNMAEVATPDPSWREHDVIVLHTTLLCWRWQGTFSQSAQRLSWMRDYTGLIVAMPQDEYDHAHTLDDWMASLGVHIVLTCFGETDRALLYPRMHRRAFFVETLTGYLHPERVANARRHGVPNHERRTDIVYRANHLPFWFGWLGHIKAQLGLVAPRLLSTTNLSTDISVRPEDTILGDHWLSFLGSARAILGSESGSSVLDKRGEVAMHVRALLADAPGLSFEDTDALCRGELTRHHFAAIGPRHLESIMTGTLQVLVEGSYSNLFRPWEHYLPVKRDLSDLAEVAGALRDEHLVTRITTKAYEDFVGSGAYGYDRLAQHVLNVIDLFASVRSGTTS